MEKFRKNLFDKNLERNVCGVIWGYLGKFGEIWQKCEDQFEIFGEKILDKNSAKYFDRNSEKNFKEKCGKFCLEFYFYID